MKDVFPLCASVVANDFYVDDLLSGAADVETLMQIRKEVIHMYFVYVLLVPLLLHYFPAVCCFRCFLQLLLWCRYITWIGSSLINTCCHKSSELELFCSGCCLMQYWNYCFYPNLSADIVFVLSPSTKVPLNSYLAFEISISLKVCNSYIASNYWCPSEHFSTDLLKALQIHPFHQIPYV